MLLAKNIFQNLTGLFEKCPTPNKKLSNLISIVNSLTTADACRYIDWKSWVYLFITELINSVNVNRKV